MNSSDNLNINDLKTDENITYKIEQIINIYSTVIVFITTLYIIRRLFKSTTPSINFIKGKLQTFGSWILQFSLLFYLIFNILITYLCKKLKLKRIEIELSKYVIGSEIKNIKNYNLDLSVLMIFSLKFYEILLSSSLFILISILIPKKKKLNNNKTSMNTFSVLWAILRIPILLYLDRFRKLFEIQIVVFVSEIFLAIEFLIISIFFLIIKSKYKISNLEIPTEKINLLFFTCFIFGIFKHIVNLIDLPFQLSEIHFYILGALQFSLQLGLFLLISSIYFPYKSKSVIEQNKNTLYSKINNNNEKSYDYMNVVSIEPYIEFDEYIF